MVASGTILRSELQRLALANLPGVGVLLLDPDLRITGCAGAVHDSYGAGPALLGRRLDELLTTDGQRLAGHNVRLAFGGQSRIFDAQPRQSPERTIELKTAPLRADSGDVLGVIAVSRDVTTERSAQGTLRDSERRYRLLVEASTDVISRQTPDGTYLWVSPSVERVLGRRPSELVGHAFDDVAHPDDRERLAELLAGLRNGGDEVRHRYRLRHRDGRWIWIETVLQPIRDRQTATVTEIVGAGRDVTEDVAQRHAIERSNADLGRFAAVASHDLSEPLLVMRAYADLLLDEAADRLTETDRLRLEIISRNSEKMQALIDTMLSYATIDRATVGHELVDMGRLFDDTVALLGARIAETAATVRRGALAPVDGDARLLAVLLQNLVGNAIKFCDREPVVDVSCEETHDGWELVVSDNGIGVDADDRRQIFGMFERRDSSHPGFGLGLASALRIAELHGGGIAVASEVGSGSTFTVSLTRRRT